MYLHGGPGGGTAPTDRRHFNPEKYNVRISYIISFGTHSSLNDRSSSSTSVERANLHRSSNNPHTVIHTYETSQLTESFCRSACLEENTTWDLVKDIETLRKHLSIEKWHVFGGSWVSTFLSLLSPHECFWSLYDYRALLYP